MGKTSSQATDIDNTTVGEIVRIRTRSHRFSLSTQL